MAEVTLHINAREYTVTCDDGQESHLVNLAAMIEDRVQDLVGSVGQVGEARLLMMASLLIADELQAAQAQDAMLAPDEAAPAARPGPDYGVNPSPNRGSDVTQPSLPNLTEPETLQAAEVLERCAERLESIAAHLERD